MQFNANLILKSKLEMVIHTVVKYNLFAITKMK